MTTQEKRSDYFYVELTFVGNPDSLIYEVSTDLQIALELSKEHGRLEHWRDDLADALIVVPAFHYHQQQPDPTFRLAKITKLLIKDEPLQYFEHTRGQFLLAPRWQTQSTDVLTSALTYVRHDYSNFSQQVITSDLVHWRQTISLPSPMESISNQEISLKIKSQANQAKLQDQQRNQNKDES